MCLCAFENILNIWSFTEIIPMNPKESIKMKCQDTASKQSESLYGHFVVPPMRSATRSISRPIPSQSCVPSWGKKRHEKFVSFLLYCTRETARTFFRDSHVESHLAEKYDMKQKLKRNFKHTSVKFHPYCWWKKSCTTCYIRNRMKHAMFPYQLVQDFFHQQICLSSSWIFGLFWKDILYPDPNLPPTLKSCHTFSPHNGTMSNKNTLFPLKKTTGKSHAFYPWVSKKPGSCREIRKPSFVSVPSQGFHANRCDSTCHCGSTAGRSLKKSFQLRFVGPSKFHFKATYL